MKILEETTKKYFATGYIALLIGAVVLGFGVLPQTARAATSSVGVAIPLYTYPTDGSWAAVIQAKQAYPNVPFIAVINPNSGPGTSQDSNYVLGIKNLQAAGVKVLGYVATGYGANSISSDESQAASYYAWYGVNGIFFDEMSNVAGYESYYSTLNSYVHSLIPGSFTIGNPGTSVPTSFIGTLDILVVYESGGYPAISFVTYPGYSPTNFASVVYGVSLDATFLSNLQGVNSWVYLTNANLPNPYDVLPSYWTSEVSSLSTLNGAVTTTTTQSSSTVTSTTSTLSTSSTTTTTTNPSSGTSQLTVNAQDTTGAPLTGYYMALYQNGVTLATGFSPTTFTLNNGQSYVLESQGYGSCSFAYWLDTGSTNGQRSLSISANTVLTSVLNCGTASNPTSSAKVNSVDLSGNPITGMWTTWNQNGAVLSTGYTPATFSGTTGGTYLVTVADYLATVFCYWQDGSPGSAKTVTLSGNLVLTAHYSTTGSCPGATTITTTTSTSTTSTTPVTTTTTTSTTSTVSTTSTSSHTSTTSSVSGYLVTIVSATTKGTRFPGIYTVVKLNGATLTTGFTPLTFIAFSGNTYTISVSNYGKYVFSHWSTGSTSPTINVSPHKTLTLIAYYWVVAHTPLPYCPPTHPIC